MSNRARAAAVVTALAGTAAGVVAVAYNIAAEETASPVEVVAAESQGEVIRAAGRLREMGVSLDETEQSIAALTSAPGQAVRALVAQRWSRDRADPRQRYGRVGVLAASADVAAVEAALSSSWCEALTDPRGEGRPPHPRYLDCLLAAPVLLEPLCDVSNAVVGYGAAWQALPGDRPLLADAVQTNGGIYVEGPGYDEGMQAYEQAIADHGWQRCGE